MFLMGPCAQLKRMFDTVRIAATIIYLVAIALTLYFAFAKNVKVRIIPVVACGIVQLLALLWYSLSYIPYARTMVRKCLGL